jgi:hypothetical protein
MLHRRSLGVLASALVVALLAGGCGGSSSDDTATASISKAAFIKKANAICEKSAEKLHTDFLAFYEPGNNSKTPKAESEEYIEKVVRPDFTQQTTEISALGAPDGSEDQVEALVAAVEEGLVKAEAKPTELVTANAELFANAIKLATAYGLDACVSTY